MTDAEADDIMASVKKSGKLSDLTDLASRVYKVIDQALEKRVKAGLLTQGEAKGLRSRWKYYVPLRGEAELDPTLAAERPRKGSGVDVKGKEFHRAFGRRSRAADILAHSFMQAEEAITRAETNEVAKKFVEMAEKNPDRNFWEVNKVRMQAQFDNKTGQVTGGNAVEPGLIDVSPEVLDHLSRFFTGAAGAFVDRVTALPAKFLDGDSEVTANDIPFLRKVYGKKPDFVDVGIFYERLREIQDLDHMIKEHLRRGDKPAADSLIADHPAEYKLLIAARNYAKYARKNSQRRRELRGRHELGRVTDEQYRTYMDNLKEDQMKIVRGFNSLYIETVGSNR